MKRKVLSIVPTIVLGALIGACKSSPEPERSPPPTEQTGQIMEQQPEQRADTMDQALDNQNGNQTNRQPGDQTNPMGQMDSNSLRQQVQGALQGAEGLDASHINVVVAENGVVHLSGTVLSEEEKRRAHDVVHDVPGVRNVYISQLEVDTSQARK